MDFVGGHFVPVYLARFLGFLIVEDRNDGQQLISQFFTPSGQSPNGAFGQEIRTLGVWG